MKEFHLANKMKLRNNLFHLYFAVMFLIEMQSNKLEVLLLDEKKYSKLEKKKILCGTELTQILHLYCKVHNDLTEHRVKRQIANECCHKPCSISHILNYYCAISNSKALESYLSQPEEDYNTQGDERWDPYSPKHSTSQVKNDPSHTYRQRNDNGINQDLQRESTNSGTHPRSANAGSRRKPRDKSNCACRKHTNKKSKRTNKLVPNGGHILRKTKRVPEPKIGQIEDSQKPFYVLNRFKRDYLRI